MFCVQVTPEERHQLAFAQSADQLQVEHGQDISGVGSIRIGLEVFRKERFHLHLLHLGSDAVVGGGAWNQSLFNRSLEGTVEGEVDAPYCSATQSRISLSTTLLDSAVFHQVFVELLQITGGQLLQLDLSDAWDGVGLYN